MTEKTLTPSDVSPILGKVADGSGIRTFRLMVPKKEVIFGKQVDTGLVVVTTQEQLSEIAPDIGVYEVDGSPPEIRYASPSQLKEAGVYVVEDVVEELTGGLTHLERTVWPRPTKRIHLEEASPTLPITLHKAMPEFYIYRTAEGTEVLDSRPNRAEILLSALHRLKEEGTADVPDTSNPLDSIERTWFPIMQILGSSRAARYQQYYFRKMKLPSDAVPALVLPDDIIVISTHQRT